jgi:hypothetical protein
MRPPDEAYNTFLTALNAIEKFGLLESVRAAVNLELRGIEGVTRAYSTISKPIQLVASQRDSSASESVMTICRT